MPNGIRNIISFARAGAAYIKETRDAGLADRIRIRRKDAMALVEEFGLKLTYPEDAAFEANGPSIYVVNHSSLMDALFIYATFPIDIRILAKASLFKLPYLGTILKREKHIRVYRGKHSADRNASIRASIHEALEEGASVAIFPEGTRTATGAIGPFKRGAFYNAVQNGVHVVPVLIRGAFEAMPKTTISIKPGNCSLELLPPVEPPDVSMGDESVRAEWMAEEARNAMIRALGNNV